MYQTIILVTICIHLLQQLSALCPLECICELDYNGRRKVLCPYGGMSGPIPISQINTNTEVLEITAPSFNQNWLIIGPIFQQFKVLEELHVTFSNVPNIGKQSFWGLTTLKLLNLTHNNISELVDYNFQGLYNLEELYLDDNHIEQLHSGTFRFLPNLRILSLVNNLISELVPRLLLNLGKLQTLNLSGNRLNELKVEVFKDVQLRVLRCRACTLSFINTELYYLLPYLKEIDLGDNDFKYFLNDAFVDLKRIRILYLDGNYLSVLLKNLFSNQRQMEKLTVARNRIALITDTTFDNATSLIDLNLSYNKLRKLSARIFKPLSKSLEILDLSGNLISTEELQISLRVLSNLKDLSLTDMQLSNLPVEMFENNPYLENLNFANNIFHNFITTPLQPLRYLITLNLTANQFRGLDEYTVTRLDEISRVHLENNPWFCDLCHITSMLKHINTSRFLANITCSSPKNLQGIQLKSLKHIDLDWCQNNEISNEINETQSFAIRIFGSDQNMNGIVVASVSILAVLIIAIVSLIVFFFYSKRHEADYYTNEEKRANGHVKTGRNDHLLDNKSSLIEHLNEKHKEIQEIGYKFNLDVISNGDINCNEHRRLSISLIDPIRQFTTENSNGQQEQQQYVFSNRK